MTSVAVLYSGGQGDEASELLFSYMAVQPTAARKVILNAFITTLKGAGIWQKLDLLYVLAAHDAQAARLNWIAPQANALVATNSPVFTVDQGYAGDAVAARLELASWTPGQQTQNSAVLGIYVRTAASYDGATLRMDLFTSPSRMNRRNSTDSAAYQFRVNDGTSATVAVAAQTGHFAVRRTASNERSLWREGAQVTTNSQASTAAPTKFELFAINGTAPSDSQLSLAYAGAQIDDTAMAAMHTAIASLKTGIGF